MQNYDTYNEFYLLKQRSTMPLNQLATAYVQLTLNINEHHTGYVDAYYGPKEWQQGLTKLPLTELAIEAERLYQQITELAAKNHTTSQTWQLRLHSLEANLRAAKTFIAHLQGHTLSFDQESLALYDAVSPHYGEADFDTLLGQLDTLLPSSVTFGSSATLNQRLNDFRSQFIIPKQHIAKVFNAAIEKARELTAKHISLPAHENFNVALVTNQVWSAYNWFKGNSYSLIEVNTDFPIYIDRAVDLACHEGYPGHHVFNSLIEENLYLKNGWVEYCVYPLFSPLSLLAEGSANYGIEVVFDKKDRMTFEQNVLFPLAELDSSQVELYYQVLAVLHKLSYVDNMVARRYLDAEITHAQAIELLMKYALSDEKKSQQRLKFIEQNRSYVLNYNLGQDLTKAYVENQLAQVLPANATPLQVIDLRWQILTDLLRNPRCASMLK
ncbi:hypothetical protein [Pseudoalteromonas tunicata]|uniref:hypothetical protein n=1 Tax=Pseudoalteromonas tunicata TaxID=314281 RepID=UPI00273DC186|nr:hypothetical protein [Pseudoalteromonas tunicata]MDP4982469.1 hypothetical protein [Pseudoalteromonas tunicata]